MAEESIAEDKRFSGLRFILGLIDRYGVALVFLCLFVWGAWHVGGRLYDDFLIPMRNGHMEYLKTSGEAQVETSKAVEAIKSVVEETRSDNDAIRAFGMEHFAITKETRDDVREIKAAVVPPKAAFIEPHEATGVKVE